VKCFEGRNFELKNQVIKLRSLYASGTNVWVKCIVGSWKKPMNLHPMFPVESHWNDHRNFHGNIFVFEDLLDRSLIHIML
jgi:hypothetical protein